MKLKASLGENEIVFNERSDTETRGKRMKKDYGIETVPNPPH
jgi:hypothetical protein